MALATTSNAASGSAGSPVLTASTAATACSGEQSVRWATMDLQSKGVHGLWWLARDA